jgi:hypothetical protein
MPPPPPLRRGRWGTRTPARRAHAHTQTPRTRGRPAHAPDDPPHGVHQTVRCDAGGSGLHPCRCWGQAPVRAVAVTGPRQRRQPRPGGGAGWQRGHAQDGLGAGNGQRGARRRRQRHLHARHTGLGRQRGHMAVTAATAATVAAVAAADGGATGAARRRGPACTGVRAGPGAGPDACTGGARTSTRTAAPTSTDRAVPVGLAVPAVDGLRRRPPPSACTVGTREVGSGGGG